MILFVYNADSGFFNAALGHAHKLLSPSTYPCRLCQLTHGALAERRAWKEFREELTEEVTFLHRDEYESRYNVRSEYPIILRNSNRDATVDGNSDAELAVVLSSQQIKECADVTSLIQRLKTKLHQDSKSSFDKREHPGNRWSSLA